VPDRQRSRDLAIAAAFGQRVREVRTAKNMTQEALAEAAGLHPTFISNVERGYRVPTVPTLLRLADGLSVAPSVLVDSLTNCSHSES
jgi:transcriptional regulator with XRE-family HTH domain